MGYKMKINCYAVFDAKIADYHLSIFDIKDEGAIRQFYDVLGDQNHRWAKHPEDYSLWSVGTFDTTKGTMEGWPPINLVNAVALKSVKEPAK